MSDESDDKTEAPTPHRLEKAREEGQIPRSRELTSLLILLVGVCYLVWRCVAGPSIVGHALRWAAF